jgi:hypothetical protein
MEVVKAITAVVGVPVLWIALSLLLSYVGGWAALAKRYRADQDVDCGVGESFRFCSGSFGATSYGSCLTIGIHEKGLRLSVLFPFRIAHPPLFIPWSDFQNIHEGSHWFISPRFLAADIGNPAIAHIMLPAWVFDHLPAKMKS